MKISIIVHPNSKNPRIEKDLLGTLHVYVNQPPLEGKANAAALASLADYFNIPKSRITLLSGLKSKNKIIEITELD